MAADSSLKSIFFALSANAGITVLKVIGAVITGSGSMLAEAIHSAADCGNQGLLLLGLKRAKKPPTEMHPLGYGKAIYFWSFLVAIMLFSMGGLFSIYEGLHKLSEPSHLDNPWWAVGILGASLVLELGALLGALAQVKKIKKKGQGLYKWFKSTRQSELMVVVGEDFAAVLGLTFALSAIIIYMITNNPVWDAIGSIGIGVLLIIIAVGIATEVRSLLIGESAADEVKDDLRKLLEERKEIDHIFNLLTLQLGSQIMVAVKAKMKEKKSADKLIADVNACEKEIKSKFPEVSWIFFEPDVTDVD